MKILFTILLVIIGLIGKTQTRPVILPSPNAPQGYYKIGWVQADSGLIAAKRDTTGFLPRFSGTIVMRPQNRNLYMYDSVALAWKRILFDGDIAATAWGSITGTLSDQTDLWSVLQSKMAYTDTASMLFPYLRKVDTTSKWVTSIFRSNDSVFYVKGGLPIFGFKDSTGGGGGGNISGSLVAGRVTLSTGTNTIGDDAGFTFDATLNRGTIDSLLSFKARMDSLTINKHTISFARIESINAFGDSYTNPGSNATSFDSSWIGLARDYLKANLYNYAASGTGIWCATLAHNQRVTGYQNAAATFIMSGFNDRPAATWKTYRKVANGYHSVSINHFASYYASGGGAGVTRYGTWTTGQNAQTHGGKSTSAAFTSTLNDSIVHVFDGNNIAIVLLGGDSTNYSTATVEVFIDNISQGLFYTNNAADGQSVQCGGSAHADQRIPFGITIAGLSNGQHTVKVVNTTSGKFMYVDYFSVLSNNAPPLVMFNLAWNQAGVPGSNNAIDSLYTVLKLRFPTYPIFKATTYVYFDPVTGGSGDGIHPNNIGHRQIFTSFKSAYDSLLSHSQGTFLNGTDNKSYIRMDSTFKNLAYLGQVWAKGDANIQAIGTLGIPASKVFSYQIGGQRVLWYDDVLKNLIVGPGGNLTMTGQNNNIMSPDGGALLTVGNNNTIRGRSAGLSLTIGNNNYYDGPFTGAFTSSGSNNTGINLNANQFGNGDDNTAIGAASLQGVNGFDHFRNVSVGVGAAQPCRNCDNGIYIGNGAAGSGSTRPVRDGDKNIVIAYNGGLPDPDINNFINFGNLIFGANATAQGIAAAGQVGIRTYNVANNTLRIDGSVGINKDSVPIITTLTSHYFLVQDTTSGADSGKIKRILPSNIITSASLSQNQIGVGNGSNQLSGSSAYTHDGTTVRQTNTGAESWITSTSALSATSGGKLYLLTSNSPTANTDQVGAIFFGYNNAGTVSTGASIRAYVPSAWTAPGTVPTRLDFYTANTTEALRMSILNNGNVAIGTTSASGLLTLAAGSTGRAAITLTSGTDHSSPAAGMLFFGSSRLAFVPTGTTPKRFALMNDVTPTAGGILQGNGTDFTLLALGTANQQLRVNAGGTALEYFTPSAGGNTIYTGDGTLSGARTVTGSNNSLTFLSMGSFTINSGNFFLAKNDASYPYQFLIGGPTNALIVRRQALGGAGLIIDTAGNAMLGAAFLLPSHPFYTLGGNGSPGTGASLNGFTVGGGYFEEYINITTTRNIPLTYVNGYIDATAGDITLTLPTVASSSGGNYGWVVNLKRVDASANTVTIQISGGSGDTIDGNTSITLSPNESKKIQSAGSNKYYIK